MPESSSLQKGIARIKSVTEDANQTLGSGFSEEVYDHAMQVGLRLARSLTRARRRLSLSTRITTSGEGYPDLVIRCGDERIIVELKAVSGGLGASEEQQLPRPTV